MQKNTLFLLTLFVFSCAAAQREPAASNDSFALLKELSSPSYEGRGVGTKGLDRARDLIESEVKKLGLLPVVDKRLADGKVEKSYLQPLRVFIGNELGDSNGFAGSAPSEFMPLAFSKSGYAKNAPLAFVGFGITLRQGGKNIYDDYAGLDVKGKIVVAFLGDPGTGNPKSPFRDPANYHFSSPMYKVQNAELHGAAGIVLVRDPLSLDGAEPPLRFQSRQGGGATSSILAGQASVLFAQKILGKNLTELQKKISASQKPASFLHSRKVDLVVELTRHLGEVQNIVGYLPGKSAALAKEFIVIGAHYDHLGYGGDSSMDPGGTGKIHHGADDNASGVQAVLHLASMIKARGDNQRPILFALFSAEEVGLLGSKQFVETLPLPEGARVAAMINLDMVGRMKDQKLTVLALRSAKEFGPLIDKVNENFRFHLSKGDSGFGSSDHASFLLQKIPSLFFTTGAHEDYHRPSDTAEKINEVGLLEVEKFVYATWAGIDGAARAPEYDPSSENGQEPPRQGRGYGAYFGSIPDFAQSSEELGVLLQGVKPESPAEKAGLQAKDILTGMGELKIKNLYDFVFALRFYRPNETIKITWMRDGKSMQAMATLKNRDQ